jgi:beta-lactamase regulating signal transducer with metallopeptidase domain
VERIRFGGQKGVRIVIAPLQLQAIAEISAAHLIDCLIEGTLVAFSVALVLRLRRKESSGAKFAIWFSALIAIAALPFMAGAFSSIQPLSGSVLPVMHHSAVTLPASWAFYLFAGWISIAMLSLLRVAISLCHVRFLRRSCIAIDPAQIDPLLRNTLENAGPPSPVLCTSDRVQVPTAIGFFRPAIVIPAWLLHDLSPDELNQILLHELAHLRRRDDWTNLIQKIVKAIFFFHPAIWWIEKKLSLEREMACDDAVVAATAQPRAYAQCLTHLAERTLIRRSIALAQAALGRVRHTSLRVAKILNPSRHVSTPRWKPALSLIAAVSLGSAVLASREPQLISFQDSSAPAAQRLPHPTRFSLGGNSMIEQAVSAEAAPLKPIPASFKLPPSSQPETISHSLPHRAALQKPQNKITNLAISTPAPSQKQNADSAIFAFMIESSMVNPNLANPNFVHPANLATNSAISTQTIFVIVQDPHAAPSGEPIYQIHFWQVTVFHPATAGKHAPNKET